MLKKLNKLNDSNPFFQFYYCLFKIFRRFRLLQIPRLILHNQVALTTYYRIPSIGQPRFQANIASINLVSRRAEKPSFLFPSEL